MNKHGKVVRWEADRGFGFIRSPGTSMDVFFHIRDFRGPGAPTEGFAAIRAHQRSLVAVGAVQVLHGLNLLGGWPAARIAQQVLRHKSAKTSFKRTYWLIVWLTVCGLVAWAWTTW